MFVSITTWSETQKKLYELFFFFEVYYHRNAIFYQLISVYCNLEVSNLTKDDHIQRTFFWILVRDLKLRMYSKIILKSNITFYMIHTGLVVTSSVIIICISLFWFAFLLIEEKLFIVKPFAPFRAVGIF